MKLQWGIVMLLNIEVIIKRQLIIIYVSTFFETLESIQQLKFLNAKNHVLQFNLGLVSFRILQMHTSLWNSGKPIFFSDMTGFRRQTRNNPMLI